VRVAGLAGPDSKGFGVSQAFQRPLNRWDPRDFASLLGHTDSHTSFHPPPLPRRDRLHLRQTSCSRSSTFSTSGGRVTAGDRRLDGW